MTRDLADEFYDEIHDPTRGEPAATGCDAVRELFGGHCPEHDPVDGGDQP